MPVMVPISARLPQLTFVACLILLLTGPRAMHAQSGEPLPDVQAVALEVRKRVMSDRELQSRYTFIERREEIDISWLGKVSKGPVKTYEVYPSVEPGSTFKRLIAMDGKPVSAAELERQDRKHREDVLRELQRREHESPAERAKRATREAKERAEREAMYDEVLEAYNMKLLGREQIDGHPALVATLDPKPGYRARTEAGEFMKKVRGKLWVSERDYQIIRAEGEMIDDMTYGWGVIGRLYKGSRAIFERRRVNGEVWLPARAEFTGNGRAALFRKFSLNTVTTYSDYRKFTVRTEESTKQ
jgi:hypothetical protein